MKIFSICHWCQRHWRCTLSWEYLLQIFAKTWNSPNGMLRGLRKLIHEENLKSKVSWHCLFMWKSIKQDFLNAIFYLSSRPSCVELKASCRPLTTGVSLHSISCTHAVESPSNSIKLSAIFLRWTTLCSYLTLLKMAYSAPRCRMAYNMECPCSAFSPADQKF